MEADFALPSLGSNAGMFGGHKPSLQPLQANAENRVSASVLRMPAALQKRKEQMTPMIKSNNSNNFDDSEFDL